MQYLILLLLLITTHAREFHLYPEDPPRKLKRLCHKAYGGDVIYLHKGVYTQPFPKIVCYGSTEAPLTITAYQSQRVVLRQGLRIKGAYLLVSHLHFRGYSDRLHYEDVIRQWWRPRKNLRRGGLLISGHHITLRDNTVGYFTASGIKFKGKSDYLTIDHNIIYNNAWWSTGGTGGLIIKTIYQIDHAKKAKIKIKLKKSQ